MGDAAHSLKMSACHKDWTQDVIRPSTWDVAREFWNWGGANAMDTDVIRFVRIPAIVRGKDAPAGCARIDITPRLAMDNRRAFGYLAKIFDSSATQNTDTPYRMTAIIQIAYFDQHGDPPSWFWAKTNLFFRQISRQRNRRWQSWGSRSWGYSRPPMALISPQLEAWRFPRRRNGATSPRHLFHALGVLIWTLGRSEISPCSAAADSISRQLVGVWLAFA